MPNVEIAWGESRVEHQRPRMPLNAADLPWFGLFAIGAVWTLVSAGLSGGDAAPVVLLFAVVGVAFAAARVATVLSSSFVPIVVVASAAWVLATSSDPLNRFPFSGPFGYTNATGAFYAQAAIAAFMLAIVWRRPWMRGAAAVAAIGLAWVPFAVDSRTPLLLVLTLPLVALAVQATSGPRAAVACCALLFAISLATTTALAVRYSDEGVPAALGGVVAETVTERRILLWHEALVIMMQHPGSGVGPGRFATVSPAAQENRDTTRWAHNSFLQQGAEAGIPGFIVVLLIWGYGFVQLSKVSSINPAAVPGAVSLAVLGINASLDYVLHFAAIPIVVAALVGAATLGSRPKGGEA